MAVQRSLRVGALIIAGWAGVTMSGCGRLGSQSRVDPLTIAVYPGGESRRDPGGRRADGCSLMRGAGSYSRGAIDLDCFVFPEDQVRAGITATPTAGWLAYRRAAASRTDRNRLTALLLKHSDDVCVEEMGRLTANEATVNTSLSVLATGATTAANIVTGDLAQHILTGVGTLAGATRSHLNSYVYRNTFAYAISRAITIERQRLRGLLEARYGLTPDQFTVDEAIRAANEYHGTCSFYKGLELILASVEGDQRSRDAQLRLGQIDAIDQEIARQNAQLLSVLGDARKPYEERINNLHAQRQALVLAGAQSPAPPRPAVPPSQTPLTTTVTP